MLNWISPNQPASLGAAIALCLYPGGYWRRASDPERRSPSFADAMNWVFTLFVMGLVLVGCAHPRSADSATASPPGRSITAHADGRVIAVDRAGRKELIGNWSASEGILSIKTIKRNSEAIAGGEIIMCEGAKYSADVLVNRDKWMCLPVGGPRAAAKPGE